MSPPRQHDWLLCYDIADPRRLGRVHRYMKDQGIAFQYSVFQLRASHAQLDMVIDRLKQLIDPREDDIRIYPLHKRPRKVTIGRCSWLAGVMLFDNRRDLLGD